MAPEDVNQWAVVLNYLLDERLLVIALLLAAVWRLSQKDDKRASKAETFRGLEIKNKAVIGSNLQAMTEALKEVSRRLEAVEKRLK